MSTNQTSVSNGLANSRNSKQSAPTAKEINEAYRRSQSIARTAVEEAVRCGEMLAAKKLSIGPGKFDEWVKAHCDFGRSSAYAYMKVAKNPADLVGKSIRQILDAGKARRTPPVAAHKSSSTLDDSVKTAAEKAPFSNPAEPSSVVQKPIESPPTEPAPKSVHGELILAGETAEEYEPERVEWTDAEVSALNEKSANADAEFFASVQRSVGTDGLAEIKRLTAELASVKLSRDGYMDGKAEITQLLVKEQNKNKKLQKRIADLEKENEKLRERIAIMEA